MRGYGYVQGAISAVIVQYNNESLTRKLLASLPRLHEVVCVQNGSGEQPLGTQNAQLSANVGWGRGTNAGAALAEGEYLLLLNNDVECHEGFLEPLVAQMEAGVGCVAGTLLNDDGSIQHAGIDLFFDQQGTLTATNRGESTDARSLDCVSLAAALVRAEAFWHVGGISPTYWCGYEDVDFCLKLRQGGWDVRYTPDSVATHGPHGSGPDRWAHVQDNIRELHSRWADMLAPSGAEHGSARGSAD